MKSFCGKFTIGFAHSDETGLIHGQVEPDWGELKCCRDELSMVFAHSDETGLIHGPVEPDWDELKCCRDELSMAPPVAGLHRIV